MRRHHRVRLADGGDVRRPAVPAERARLLDARRRRLDPAGARCCMVIVAPRSAKLVEARGARFTLLIGYVFCLLGFLTMLLLWKDGIPYWKVGLGYALRGRRRRLRRHARLALADRLGAGQARGDGVGHRRPAARPRRRDHAVDPRRAADRRLRLRRARGDRRLAEHGAGHARACKPSWRSRSRAPPTSPQQLPAVRRRDHRGGEDLVRLRRQVGLHAPASSRSCSVPRSCSSASRGASRSWRCWRGTTRRTRRPARLPDATPATARRSPRRISRRRRFPPPTGCRRTRASRRRRS